MCWPIAPTGFGQPCGAPVADELILNRPAKVGRAADEVEGDSGSSKEYNMGGGDALS
jgi:hypothetical protein